MRTDDFLNSLKKLKDRILTFADNISLKKQICEILTDCEIFLPHSYKNDEIIDFVRAARNKLMNLARSKEYSDLIYSDWCKNDFYAVLTEIAKLAPYNNSEGKDPSSPSWICPISDKSTPCYLLDNSFIALSTGYVYEKESLFTWFKTSKRFLDPVTREQLPEFDIQRILKLNQGLQKVAEIQIKFNQLKKELREKQELRFASSMLTWRDAIKKHFLVLTSNEASHTAKEHANQQLKTLKQKYTEQKPSKKNSKNQELNNFSNLDLSGLTFYNHHLVSPYVVDSNGHLDLRGANLSGCHFLGQCSTGECLHADLSHANLEGARFANLPGGGICIKTSDFSNANLRNVDFTGVGNWGGVKLTHADLRGAFLYDKEGLKLTGPDLKKYLQRCEDAETALYDPAPESQADCVDTLTQAAGAAAASTDNSSVEARPSFRR